MARAFRPAAASPARRVPRGLRTAVALVVVGILSLTSSAMLASGPAAPARVASAPDDPAPVGILTGAGTEQPRSNVPDVPVVPIVTDVPPGHGAPPPRCPVALAGAPIAKLVHHGSRTDKVVALTFDDGYNSPNVRKILAILEKAKVNATFFPIGQVIKKDPATWRAVAAAGFPIANHTYDHKNLKGLCRVSQQSELARQDAMVAKELGITPLPYMRPPYGTYDSGTRLAAAADGEQAVVLWDVDTRDWSGLSARGITARAIVGTNGSIVIMHTFVANTVSALPTIIARYKARGFTFVTVGQLLGIDGPVPFK